MNIREMALSLLCEYEVGGKYVNLSLSSHMTDGLSSEDRASLTALLYRTVERKLTYDYYIGSIAKRQTESINIRTLNILRLGLCQILDMTSIPDFAAVNETVKLAGNKGERAFVNAVLRSCVRLKESGELPLPDRKRNEARFLSVKYSFPLWMAKHFISLYGTEGAEKLFAFYNEEAPTDITVNTVKVSRKELMDRLIRDGYSVVPSENSSLSLRILGSVNPKKLYGFNDGLFFVQDEASAISSEVLSAEPSHRVADVCACPGGKSFATAILMKNEGEILSLDLHESKLSLIESGRDRLGLSIIRPSQCDARVGREELFGIFDRVICDAPCSGLGVLRKKPDMRYRSELALDELPTLQYEILESSSRYLKRGGILIYSTCTLNPKENEEVVDRFLSSHPEFSAVDFEAGRIKSKQGRYTTLPYVDRMDGFFIAKLKKDE